MSNTTTTAKVTKKSNLNSLIALIAAAEAVALAGDFDFAALTAYCENEIGLLDKKAAKAKESAAAKKTEKDELCIAVESALTDEWQTRNEVTDKIEGDDVTVAKVGYRLTKLVELGVAEKSEITAPDATGKNRKVAAYRLVAFAIDAE